MICAFKMRLCIWLILFLIIIVQYIGNVSGDVVNKIACNGNACNNTYVKTTMSCPYGQYFDGTSCINTIPITPMATQPQSVCPNGYYFNGITCISQMQSQQQQQHQPYQMHQQQQQQQQICPLGMQWNGQMCTQQRSPCGSYCGTRGCPQQRCQQYPPIYRPQPQPQPPIYPMPVYPIVPPIDFIPPQPQPQPPPLYPIPPILPPQPPTQIRPPTILPLPETPIVSPLPPQAIPPTFECDLEYIWNGYQCIKTISIEPHCPPEYNLTSGHCQHFTNGICPTNQDLVDGKCIGETATNVQCPIEYKWNGNYCVHRIPSCPDGYNLANGLCEKLIAGYCPSGTVMSNGTCNYQTITNVQCPSSYTWNGHDCTRYIASCPPGYTLIIDKCTKTITTGPIITCPHGTNLVGRQCYGSEYRCPNGFYLQNNQCIQKVNCPLGYHLQNNQCISICGENFIFENNTCVQWQQPYPPQPICPPGYTLYMNLCYPPGSIGITSPQPIPVTTPSPPPIQQQTSTESASLPIFPTRPSTPPKPILTNPLCPPGYHLRNNLCYRIKKILQPSCPDRYLYRNEQCESTEKIELPPTQPPTQEPDIEQIPLPLPPQCPPGYNLFNHSCYPELTYYEDDIIKPICDDGYEFRNGICELIIKDIDIIPGYPEVDVPVEEIPKCLPDSYWYIDRCIKYPTIVTTTEYSTECFPGFNYINGSCLPITPICPDGYVFYLNACYLKPTPRPDFNNGTTTENTYWTSDTVHDTLPINCRCQDGGGCDSQCNSCYGDAGENCQPSVQRPPTMPNIDVGHNITNDISITNIVNNNNTIDQPINVYTNNTNNIEVYLTRNSGSRNGKKCSGDVTIIRNNETYHEKRNCSTDDDFNSGDDSDNDNNNDDDDDDANNSENGSDNDSIIPYNEDDQQKSTEKCCDLISPRQCKRVGDEWSCYHRKYHRCGRFCTQPKVYLKPRFVQYAPPILVMPPPPPRYQRLMSYRSESLGYTDCSGCLSGGYGCSNYCFNYDCEETNCNYIDQEQFCETYGGEGCNSDDGRQKK